MRTTVEISDAHRAKLLELAAQRGKKGFSEIVGAAIEVYLKTLKRADSARREAQQLRGTLSEDDAGKLRKATRALRENWR